MFEQTVATRAHTVPSTTSVRDIDLDDLAAMSFEDLEAMYRAAPEPTSLRGADGRPKGRMLAVNRVSHSFLGDPIRQFAASRAFVWDGKTFQSKSEVEGRGHNRVQLPGVLGRQNLFPFETRITTSALDGRNTIVLDYDLDVNPGYIRRIHDEIREVASGLYLGPAMLKMAGDNKVLALWFALDTRTPSTWDL